MNSRIIKRIIGVIIIVGLIAAYLFIMILQEGIWPVLFALACIVAIFLLLALIDWLFK